MNAVEINGDLAIAAMKRAQLLMVLYGVCEIVYFVLAFAIRPDNESSRIVNAVQEPISLLFLAGAVLSTLGIAWNAWIWWRAYSRPEVYFD
ncbi:hypothetical protein RBA41_31140 [Massilia sp. CCM 9210]|uniref:hypothetical protein n=1 Tax=Massilia scottii TaxID=3057166 RepID=UPI002796994A|nr:hypothetical protein [Massilia sp. CCM 9210]MDQ1817765.1 hypothetical protein [Massilia sp. CCM 9210]